MKKVILLFLFLPVLASAQVVENFEQGNIESWSQFPAGRWQADTVFALSGIYSLHHSYDNDEASTDMISMPLQNLYVDEGETKWSFSVRYGYAPSASNNWFAFLFSNSTQDDQTLENLNGYAVGVNLSGYDDTLRIWEVKDGNADNVVNSNLNWQNDVGTDSTVRIIVKRSVDGTWTLDIEHLNGVRIDSSSGYSPDLFSPDRFAIMYRYTSSCDRLLWIDDISIEGIFHEDFKAPSVTRCEVEGRKKLYLTLDEQPAEGFTEPLNFSLNADEISPARITETGHLVWSLDFEDEFINKSENRLVIKNLCDKYGNCNNNVTVYFDVLWAEAGDVVISEIMPDPEPAVSLPESEYLELTNRSAFPMDISDWKLLSGSQTVSLPQFTMSPGDFLILCSEQDTSSFSSFGMVLGIKSFPALTNSGRLLCLLDSNGILIHGVEYTEKWYGSELKSTGGWSLEMIDTDYPFYFEDDWKASKARAGGTPGKRNSVAAVNPDVSFYGLCNAFPEDNRNIRVRFSEPVPFLNNSPLHLYIDGNEADSIMASDPLLREYVVTTEKNLSENVVYEISAGDDITDFAGNRPEKSVERFGLPEEVVFHDVLFNEMLFNPLPGDPDYVEIFNLSEKIVDVSRLFLATVNEQTGDTSSLYPLSSERRCLLPGSYYAVTTCRQDILKRYSSADPENIFEVSSLPSMPDNEGHLVIFNRELDVIDEVEYSDEMQNSFLASDEGVSLEKSSPASASGEAGNWHSASGSVGWGTPGGPNSDYIEIPAEHDDVIMSSTIITPDGDGYQDFLLVGFNLTGNGNVVSAEVFDETGGYVKKIADNIPAGKNTKLVWEGTADDGTAVRNGIYIILITVYNEDGKYAVWKKVCSVIRR